MALLQDARRISLIPLPLWLCSLGTSCTTVGDGTIVHLACRQRGQFSTEASQERCSVCPLVCAVLQLRLPSALCSSLPLGLPWSWSGSKSGLEFVRPIGLWSCKLQLPLFSRQQIRLDQERTKIATGIENSSNKVALRTNHNSNHTLSQTAIASQHNVELTNAFLSRRK